MAIAKSAKELERDIKRISDRLNVNINRVTRKVAFDVHAKITRRTPVDTGRARACWGMTEAKPLDVTLPEGNYGASDTRRLVSLRPGASPNGMPPVIWMWNNLPYITTLEFGGYPNPPKNPGLNEKGQPKTVGGYSRQAPTGMVRVSIAEVTADIKATLANELSR